MAARSLSFISSITPKIPFIWSFQTPRNRPDAYLKTNPSLLLAACRQKLHISIFLAIIFSLKCARAASEDISDTSSWTQLHWVASQGDDDTAQLLLDGGLDINAQDHSGRTPLHIAAQKGRLDILQFLLDKGAALNAMDSEGNTPLTLAANAGQEQVIPILLTNDAEIQNDKLTEEEQILIATTLSVQENQPASAEQPDRQSTTDKALKQAIHDGLSDDQVVVLINRQGNIDPFTHKELDSNRLEEVIVFADGQVAAHVNTIKKSLSARPTSKLPFSRRLLSPEVIDYVENYRPDQLNLTFQEKLNLAFFRAVLRSHCFTCRNYAWLRRNGPPIA